MSLDVGMFTLLADIENARSDAFRVGEILGEVLTILAIVGIVYGLYRLFQRKKTKDGGRRQ